MRRLSYNPPYTEIIRVGAERMMVGFLDTSHGASADESDDTNMDTHDGISADESDAKFSLWDDMDDLLQ